MICCRNELENCWNTPTQREVAQLSTARKNPDTMKTACWLQKQTLLADLSKPLSSRRSKKTGTETFGVIRHAPQHIDTCHCKGTAVSIFNVVTSNEPYRLLSNDHKRDSLPVKSPQSKRARGSCTQYLRVHERLCPTWCYYLNITRDAQHIGLQRMAACISKKCLEIRSAYCSLLTRRLCRACTLVTGDNTPGGPDGRPRNSPELCGSCRQNLFDWTVYIF